MSGEAMHKFFKAYAQQSDILRRINFETEVLQITRLEGTQGWNVNVRTPAGDELMKAKKLIIATGVTNQPHRPTIDGAAEFDGPIIHSAELGKRSGAVVNDPEISSVAVLGGGKSAYEAVYLAAMAGKEVEWIMRRSGKGPSWVFPSHVQLGPIRAWREACLRPPNADPPTNIFRNCPFVESSPALVPGFGKMDCRGFETSSRMVWERSLLKLSGRTFIILPSRNVYTPMRSCSTFSSLSSLRSGMVLIQGSITSLQICLISYARAKCGCIGRMCRAYLPIPFTSLMVVSSIPML